MYTLSVVILAVNIAVLCKVSRRSFRSHLLTVVQTVAMYFDITGLHKLYFSERTSLSENVQSNDCLKSTCLLSVLATYCCT